MRIRRIRSSCDVEIMICGTDSDQHQYDTYWTIGDASGESNAPPNPSRISLEKFKVKLFLSSSTISLPSAHPLPLPL